MAYETTEPPLLYSRTRKTAAARFELASTRLQDERSGVIELRRKKLMEWERLELSLNSLQDCRSAELSYHPVGKDLIAEAGLEPARSPL